MPNMSSWTWLALLPVLSFAAQPAAPRAAAAELFAPSRPRRLGTTKPDESVAPHTRGAPVIAAVTPSRIPVDGATEVVVVGSGFAAVEGAIPTCRLSPYRYITPWYAVGAPDGTARTSCRPRPGLVNAPTVSFDKPSPTGYTAPARVINATHLACTPPAVVLEGVAVLAVSMDNATFSMPSAATSAQTTGPTCLELFALFSASVSRRPYFSEAVRWPYITRTAHSEALILRGTGYHVDR